MDAIAILYVSFGSVILPFGVLSDWGIRSPGYLDYSVINNSNLWMLNPDYACVTVEQVKYSRENS